MADALELTDVHGFAPVAAADQVKVVTFVPAAAVTTLIEALSAAGAGRIGDYEQCAFTVDGVGRLRRRRVDRSRLSVRPGSQRRTGGAPRDDRPERRADAIIERVDRRPSLRGAGVRRLPGGLEPRPRRTHRHVRRLVGRARSSGPSMRSSRRVCASGGPEMPTRHRVAVVSGAGESRIAAAAAAGCDVLVSGDISHHRSRRGRRSRPVDHRRRSCRQRASRDARGSSISSPRSAETKSA